MSQGLPEPLAAGSRGDYKWLSSSHHQLDDLLRLFPNIVLGKYVAVTSFDSGPLVPNADERQLGWDNRQGIAYSPRVTSVETLPRDLYDEWYVFAQPVDLGVSRLGSNIFDPSLKPGEVGDFVNYNFALHRSGMKDLGWTVLGATRTHAAGVLHCG
jgi:hypothetical protein